MDDFFTPPPFKPAEALVQLKRSLRETRPLAERGEGFDFQGQRVIELALDGAVLSAKLAKRPARSPDWETRALTTAAQVRQFVDEVKRRVERWGDE
ncbi:hypothetical protein [Caldimonas brevitalea]|uniref:Uncharacterized protein n=1 Tax=Caldimonas brevitalea TaxID=413882 RepID=A0A0G3BTZ1_9BURK|nr:hypothetical protein [Caldimonas brevitalea]AKJ31498.1 hypothetical protein AAW51_4807 [Caldimonas brevitalea]